MSIWTDASPRSETDAIDKPVIQTVPRKLCVCVFEPYPHSQLSLSLFFFLYMLLRIDSNYHNFPLISPDNWFQNWVTGMGQPWSDIVAHDKHTWG